MIKQLSKCCSAPTTIEGKGDSHDQDEVSTMHNSCKACRQPCDVRPQKPSERIKELNRGYSDGDNELWIEESLGAVIAYLDEQAELNNQKP